MTARPIWLVRCGEGGSAVDVCISNDLLAVRFVAVGDASGLSTDEVVQAMSTMPDRSDSKRLAQELLAFVNEMQVDDIILTPDKERRRYFVARVVGDYYWNEDSPVADMRHLRNVEWINYLDWDAMPLEFRSIKYYQRAVLQIEDATVRSECETALQTQLPKTDLLSAGTRKPTKATTPRPRKAAVVRALKPSPADHERLCTSCGLKKHIAQFAGASNTCVDCA
jgi:predicted Mrr-cat superfamily restriction endonuclease